MLETFFFDLGGVLIDFSHKKMCQNIASLCQIDLDVVNNHLFEKKLSEMYERGVIDSQTLYDHFCQFTNRSFTFDQLMEALSSIFQAKEEMPPILEHLKKQRKKLFLLSNTCEAHINYVKEHFPFIQLFDGLVLSYEVTARKPEYEIFEAALALAKTDKQKAFFTDDVEMHVDAANHFGIDSHHFTGKENLITALNERGIHA